MAAQHDGKPWVSAIHVCEALGIDWQMQYNKLETKPWAHMELIPTLTPKGSLQEIIGVDCRTLIMWLATIGTNQLPGKDIPTLYAYQTKADHAVNKHFHQNNQENNPQCNKHGKTHCEKPGTAPTGYSKTPSTSSAGNQSPTKSGKTTTKKANPKGEPMTNNNIDHPPHYQTPNGLEAIDVIDAFFTNSFNLGNVFKYLARAGKKGDYIEDLKKAAYYLNREIDQAEEDIIKQNAHEEN